MEINKKILLLLRGLPASGKSTFIKQYSLQDYCISADSVRYLLWGARLWERGGLYSPDTIEQDTWKIIMYAIATRMNTGDFIVVDSCHADSQEGLYWKLEQYKNLCDLYDYTLAYKQFDTPLKECLIRSKNRSNREPYPDAIKQMAENLRNTKMPSYVVPFDSLGYGAMGEKKYVQ